MTGARDAVVAAWVVAVAAVVVLASVVIVIVIFDLGAEIASMGSSWRILEPLVGPCWLWW